jgi:hypothetical protein
MFCAAWDIFSRQKKLRRAMPATQIKEKTSEIKKHITMEDMESMEKEKFFRAQPLHVLHALHG